jgi:hypothetical protein
MFSREECELNPAAIRANIEQSWGTETLMSLEIEVRGHKGPLIYFIGADPDTKEKVLGIGFAEEIKVRDWHPLDADGREFFARHRPQFGKVRIMFPRDVEPAEYPTYDEFLSAIAG